MLAVLLPPLRPYIEFEPAAGNVPVNDALWIVAAAASLVVAAVLWLVCRPALRAAPGVNASSAEFAGASLATYSASALAWAVTEGEAQGHWETVSAVSAVVGAVFLSLALIRVTQATP